MDNTQIAARGFILDYLRHGPAEALAVYNAAQKFLGLDGPEISAALLSLMRLVPDRMKQCQR
jgi:hypothetical protein